MCIATATAARDVSGAVPEAVSAKIERKDAASRVAAGDALEAVELLLPDGISVFAFDFSGSGHSDGETISLGFYEKFDVECVVKHLRGNPTVSTIGIWGRSMGAATAVLYVPLAFLHCIFVTI